jgi:hypothetical protein
VLTALHINHARTAGLPFAALSKRITAMAGGFVIVRRAVLEAIGGLIYLLTGSSSRRSQSRFMWCRSRRRSTRRPTMCAACW